MTDAAPADEVRLGDMEHAAERLDGFVRTTPMLPSEVLSDLTGQSVLLKCENLQRTGSFKVRGATNVLAVHPAPAGVVTASAGNHGQAVALAARRHRVPATVVMPSSAPLAKQRATRGYGAQIELVDGPLSAAHRRATALAAGHDLFFVPPYDSVPLIAGQGTVGLEILAQCPEVGTVLVPAGGGGLLAGVAMAVKSLRPEARVIGVQAASMPGIVASLEAGEPVQVEARRTIADGVAVAAPSAMALRLIEHYVDDVVALTEEQIASAVVFMTERARLVVEGAGALGVGALLAGAAEAHGPTVAVVSGGNIDVHVLGRLIERGLLVDGRQRMLTVAAANVPGELARVTAAVAEVGANIIEVQHETVTSDLPLGLARIRLRLELAGNEAYDALIEQLLAAGFQRGDLTDLETPRAAHWPS